MHAVISFNDTVKDPVRLDRDLVAHLRQSEIYRDYQKAFESATGLPLAIRPVDSFQPPLCESRRRNPFCMLLAAQNRTCAAYLQFQHRLESTAQSDGATTLECFAGLSHSAVPIRVGERIVALLQTGQVFLQRPTDRRLDRFVHQLCQWNVYLDRERLREAYFRTPVFARSHYASILRLLGIFAEHLSSLSNQLMVRGAAAEAPAIVRARRFMAEHLGEDISLSEAARAAGMSTFYFCKVFKKETSLTFTGYLARLRVEAVKRALLDPHRRVSEAAYTAGFQSLSQFNRIFRCVAGETPSKYRQHLHWSEAGPVRSARAA